MTVAVHRFHRRLADGTGHQPIANVTANAVTIGPSFYRRLHLSGG